MMQDESLFVASPAWTTRHRGASAAVLAVRLTTPPARTGVLDAAREQQEQDLRARYRDLTRPELRETGHLPAYDAYYRQFVQTYHVLQQIESVAIRQKPLAPREPLVEAGFLAELATGLLTASHDLDALVLPITIDAATGTERYTLYNAEAVVAKAGDMLMRDQREILTTIILGPAAYARITPQTRSAVYCVYGPPGVSATAVHDHLVLIERLVRLIDSAALTLGSVVLTASGTASS
jgi:DNA/RNA-binding domain of Phe-tRNA-synthetase-like protein